MIKNIKISFFFVLILKYYIYIFNFLYFLKILIQVNNYAHNKEEINNFFISNK